MKVKKFLALFRIRVDHARPDRHGGRGQSRVRGGGGSSSRSRSPSRQRGERERDEMKKMMEEMFGELRAEMEAKK